MCNESVREIVRSIVQHAKIIVKMEETQNKHLPSNFISQSFRWNDSYFFADPLVGMEVQGQFWVILFDDNSGRLFNCLCTYSTLTESNRMVK